jgi:hypothetical protein
MTEPITVRKTLSRLVYAVEQMSAGKSKSEILNDIGFTEDEFSHMCDEALRIGNSSDNSFEVFLNDGLHKSDIGGTYIAIESILTAWI